MRTHRAFLIAWLLIGIPRVSLAQDSASAGPPQSAEAKDPLFDRVIANQKKVDEDLNFYERIERIEMRKNPADAQPAEVKIFRVFPAGTGVDRIPLGPSGKPADPAAYRAELEKLEHALVWAAKDGRAQRDAYQRVAKKQKERNELIDATRSAFVFTYVSEETRDGRRLAKYLMVPNPAYKPTSRATAILSKVQGFVWIDLATSQLARVEGNVIADISIGGFLAKVYKGSHFMQERYEFVPGVWLPTFSQYDFDGRKIFVPFSIHERMFYSHYRRIGPPKEALAVIRAELKKASAAEADP